MSDIYTSEDGDAVVDLQAYSAGYENRIAELEQENEALRHAISDFKPCLDEQEAENERLRQQIASLEEALRVERGGCRKLFKIPL